MQTTETTKERWFNVIYRKSTSSMGMALVSADNEDGAVDALCEALGKRIERESVLSIKEADLS